MSGQYSHQTQNVKLAFTLNNQIHNPAATSKNIYMPKNNFNLIKILLKESYTNIRTWDLIIIILKIFIKKKVSKIKLTVLQSTE